ncbi:MAG: sulfite exporter TauE/SafE family protein [Phycisphaerae bacterium]|nr:sulfite exporter TauE/SafE family protein [Phycisphaerae bacterium]
MTAWINTWIVPPGSETRPTSYVLVAAAAMLMMAVSKGGFGGLAIVSGPLLMMVTDARTALGLMLPLLLVCDTMTLPLYPREFVWRPILRLAPWVITGIVIGWFLLDHVTESTAPLLKVGVGLLAVAFVVLEIVRWAVARREKRRVKPWRPGIVASIPFGLSAGITTMLAHAAGAITVIYLLPQRLASRVFVGTTARFYFIFNAIKIPFYVELGLINRATLQRSIWLLPVCAVGVWSGSALNRRVSQRGFRIVVSVLLLLTGLMLIHRNREVLPSLFGG